MTKNVMALVFVVFSLWCGPALPEKNPIYYSSDSSKIELNSAGEPEEIILQGNVRIVFNDATITCDKARFNRVTGDFTAEKPLSMETPQGIFKADYLTYNVSEKKGVLLNVSFITPPLYGKAEKVEKKEALVVLDRGYITTCDLEKPHYRISAERIEYIQDDYIRAERMKLTFGEKFSVLYLPRFTFDVRRKKAPFLISPGYTSSSSREGETVDVIFSHRAGKETDAVVRERISLGIEGLGLGLETFSEKKGYSGSGFIYNEWDDGLQAGGLLKFGRNYSSSMGEGRVILDWRGMSDSLFFKDFFHSEFIRKSKAYNYFSFTHNLGNSILNLSFRESAGEDFLRYEKLPELRFYTPYVQVKDLPIFFENDLRLTNFYKDEEECFRTLDIFTVTGRKGAGYLTFRPYLSAGGVSYYSDVFEDRFNRILEGGTSVSALMKRVKGRYAEYFIPEISLFYRGLDYKPGEIEYFDDIEEWNNGKFVGLKSNWIFTENNDYLGRLSLENLYSIDRDEFDGSFLRYDLKLMPRVYLEGENEWNLNKARYKFGVNDIVIKAGRYNYSLGNRYNEEDDTSGIAGRLEYRVSQNFRYALKLNYDVESGNFTRESLEIWKKIHCWEMNFSITVDGNDFSFFITAYPIFL